LQNGCYVQISGTPVVELRVLEKKTLPTGGGGSKIGDEKKGGRKTHVRAVKKRGKKRKRQQREYESDIEVESTKREAREKRSEEGDAMDIDDVPPTALLPTIVIESTQSLTAQKLNTKPLGASASAPSLLVTPAVAGQSLLSPTPRSLLSQLPLPSNSIALTPSTQTKITLVSSAQNKLGSGGGFKKLDAKRTSKKKKTLSVLHLSNSPRSSEA
jgi:hypothetical protein